MKFKVGTKVRIVKYGHLVWENKNVEISMFKDRKPYKEDDFGRWYDTNPELIGKTGIITEKSGNAGYSIDPLGAWFRGEQLEAVTLMDEVRGYLVKIDKAWVNIQNAIIKAKKDDSKERSQ